MTLHERGGFQVVPEYRITNCKLGINYNYETELLRLEERTVSNDAACGFDILIDDT
jgi:hypothetical protein